MAPERETLDPLSSVTNHLLAEREFFQFEWSKFAHRVRMHEVLRHLESEHRKLTTLGAQTSDLTELLNLDSNEFLDDYGDDQGPDSILFMRSLEQEKAAAEVLSEEVRKAELDEDFIIKAALKLFHSNLDVSEEQFDEILQLCQDKADQQKLREAFHEKVYRHRYLRNATERRKMLYDFLNSHIFNRFLLVMIALSTLIIVLLTFETIEVKYIFPLRILDALIISIFVVEAVCKINIYKISYFKSLWNILDLLIIGTHLVEIGVEFVTKLLALNTNINRSIVFRLLKSLRSLRLLRTIKFLPNLQVIVSTIFQSMVSLGSIAVLMFIIMVIFAVVGRGLFKVDDPRHFESIFPALLTLFQLLTLDDWFDLPDDFDNDDNNSVGDYILFFLFLFIYILFEYFVFMNLFVAVLVDNFQLALEDAQFGGVNEKLDLTDKQALGITLKEENDRLLEKKAKGIRLDLKDYYELDPESRELKLLIDNLRLLESLDFEYSVAKRRLNIVGCAMDIACANKVDAWTIIGENNEYKETVIVDDDEEEKKKESTAVEKGKSTTTSAGRKSADTDKGEGGKSKLKFEDKEKSDSDSD